ncbi:MAG: hypothetical protein ACXV5H_01675 [Halobacteriota archaeon]
MAFTEVTILEVDYKSVKACSENEIIVPYLLSNLPPVEWRDYFEKHAPASACAKIVGKIAWYKCQKDKTPTKKRGACWNTVADLVDDANRYYLGVELRRHQELGRQAEREHQEEQGPREFEIEWDRYMSRD